MHRVFTLTAASLMTLVTAAAAQAQMVRVGPFGGVEVRLPRLGVSVDVLPFGQGSRVRAPFTAVDTGAYRYGYPVRPNPVYEAPTGYAVTESLREAASQLQHELTRRPDGGEAWLDYLAPHLIIAAIDNGSHPQSLRNLLNHYEGVANSQLPDVYSTAGFRRTHELLSQWVNGVDPAATPQDDQPPQQTPPAEPASTSTAPAEPTAEELPAPAAAPDE